MEEKQRRELFKRVKRMQKMQEQKMDGISNKQIKLKFWPKVFIPVALIIILSLFSMQFLKEPIQIANKNNLKNIGAMTYDTVETNESNTDSEYVKFDAFFLKDLDNDGYAEKIRGTCNEIGKDDVLYMELNVLTNGYLENGVITINGENFYFNASIPKDNEVKENYEGINIGKIELNKINNGTQKIISGSVRAGKYNTPYKYEQAYAIKDKDGYSKINSVTLTGTHVETLSDGTTKETEIEKTINFQVDWYGEISCKWYIPNSNQYNKAKKIYDDEKEELNVEFKLILEDEQQQLLVEGIYMEFTMPDINGYKAIRIENQDSDKYHVEYDANTGKAKIKYEYNKVFSYPEISSITVIYPKEAYESIKETGKIIEIPVQVYLKGYNNPNEEFQNPYMSNIVNETIRLTVEGKQANLNMSIYSLSKKKPLRIYNGISNSEKEDRYKVQQRIKLEQSTTNNGMIIKEKYENEKPVADSFKKSDGTYDSMENITKYVGIYTNDLYKEIADDGYMKIYNDETNELITTLNKEQIQQYNTEKNAYMLETPIKHIRIETSSVNTNSVVSFYYIKELDDEYITEHYTREEFDKLEYVKATLVTYMDNVTIEQSIEKPYKASVSPMELSLNKSAVSTQQEENLKLTIEANNNESIAYVKGVTYAEWKNGDFLIKLPSEVINVNINSIQTDNPKLRITDYKIEEKDGNKFIRIKTQNDELQYYTINININLRIDPMSPTKSTDIELYGANPVNPEYEKSSEDLYDVDNNGNITEKVGKTTTSLTLTAPNSLLSNEKAKNYDEENSIAMAPNKAHISKERRKATIAIEIKNNYESTISEISILGKIPTVNTNHVISGNPLGSTYETTLADTGIILPEEIKAISTIYYSEQLNPTKDLTNSANGWTTTPDDFTKIKSFYIQLGDYVLSKEELKEITYDVNIPEGVDYNEISNAQHAVYFCLDTKDGKYRTQTEPEKLGLMIAKEYNLELTKYELYNENGKKVQGATYTLNEIADDAKTEALITQEDGKIIFQNLLVEKNYLLKETISPEGYELNPETIEFTVIEENNEPKIIINKGIVKNNSSSIDTNGKYLAQIDVEDELTANKAEPITVHHYIYDEATNTYTTTSVPLSDGTTATDEIKKGKNGTSIELKQLDNIDLNYEIYEEPEQTTVVFSKQAQEFTYYYKLKESTLSSEITKTATANKMIENVPVLTEERGVVIYNIKYIAQVANYSGNAKFTIVDQLPANIDETKSDLAGGTYNEENKTITWEENLELNTYTNGIYTYNANKIVKLVYTNQDITTQIENTATGKVTIYYPNNYIINPGNERNTIQASNTAIVTQEYTIDKQVKKVWDDNENIKNRRPESVTITLTADGQNVENSTVILNKDNEWKYQFVNLPKYKEDGTLINYSVIETETNKDDLKYYEEAEITGTSDIIVTNKYKLLNTELDTKITKETEDIINSSTQEIKYKINYQAKVTDYIGEALITIKDQLPYEIDEEKSNIGDGTYNKELKTITWTERIENINAEAEIYDINISKEITIVYKDLDKTLDSISNKVSGTIELYETEKKNTVEAEEITDINIQGKVIVKYLEKETNKELKPSVEQTGKVGTEYKTTKEIIENYECEENTTNATGTFSEKTIEVVYYYKKIPTSIVIKYIDKETGNELYKSETINGYVGDEYKIERKDITNYQKVNPEPTNEIGKMTKEPIEIIYYYEKIPSGTLTVKYLDTDTKEEIKYKDENGEEKSYSYKIEGKVGDKYETEEKEIPYYKKYETSNVTNKTGELTKEDMVITYYYKKMEFNFEISKKIASITVNGSEQDISHKINKVEISTKKIKETNILVKYVITVKNTGELEGTATVQEQIPEGFKLSENNLTKWKQDANGKLEYNIELKAGESKDLEIILNWEQNENNFGEKKNIATLTNTNNPAGYAETNTEDNSSQVSFLISVKTGSEIKIILLILLFVLSSSIVVVGYEKKRKQ